MSSLSIVVAIGRIIVGNATKVLEFDDVIRLRWWRWRGVLLKRLLY